MTLTETCGLCGAVILRAAATVAQVGLETAWRCADARACAGRYLDDRGWKLATDGRYWPAGHLPSDAGRNVIFDLPAGYRPRHRLEP